MLAILVVYFFACFIFVSLLLAVPPSVVAKRSTHWYVRSMNDERVDVVRNSMCAFRTYVAVVVVFFVTINTRRRIEEIYFVLVRSKNGLITSRFGFCCVASILPQVAME